MAHRERGDMVRVGGGMRKRTARKLRRIADRLDPKPARWYQVGVQTQSFAQTYTLGPHTTGIGDANVLRAHRRRVLADYLTTMDLKKLRP
jgi:hypothetical protein